ncbi:MAG: hypothetical protein QOD75_1985 [Blastocatellia bacterium]|jgi:hypothetical protein|nr:hypothetical protein [Blastocatellia bacterium]
MKHNDAQTHEQLADSLAPAEEQRASGSAQLAGSSSNAVPSDSAFAAIVVDSDDVNLSQDIVDRPPEKTFLGMEPLVLAILGFMLAFIAFIAWQISQMPPE